MSKIFRILIVINIIKIMKQAIKKVEEFMKEGEYQAYMTRDLLIIDTEELSKKQYDAIIKVLENEPV